jgi:hypothetical protein
VGRVTWRSCIRHRRNRRRRAAGLPSRFQVIWIVGGYRCGTRQVRARARAVPAAGRLILGVCRTGCGEENAAEHAHG